MRFGAVFLPEVQIQVLSFQVLKCQMLDHVDVNRPLMFKLVKVDLQVLLWILKKEREQIHSTVRLSSNFKLTFALPSKHHILSPK